MSTNAPDGGIPPAAADNTNASSSTFGSRSRSRSDAFLLICRFFNFTTALAALLCIVVNVLSAIRSFKHDLDIFDGIFRCYAVLIAILVAVAETEWGLIFQFWKVLEYWAGRGMLQIFVAVMTRAYPEYADQRKDLILLQQIASYVLLSCGVIYIISGILCMGVVKRARQKKETSREQAVRDLEELDKRREELEALLIQQRV